MQNIFLNGSADPLMGGATYQAPNIDEKIEQLKQVQQQLEIQKQQMSSRPEMVKASAPVWDEIDKVTTSLSEREFELINGNEEFQQSQQVVMSILQREYMRIMRPIVENTKDGKDALDKHLTLVKRLKKSVTDENNKNLELFNEYTEKYSDMTYSDFLKMKKGGRKK